MPVVVVVVDVVPCAGWGSRRVKDMSCGERMVVDALHAVAAASVLGLVHLLDEVSQGGLLRLVMMAVVAKDVGAA